MNNAISHAGIVEEVGQGVVRVRITQQSACSTCKVASACHASDSKEKIIDIYGAGSEQYHKGDAVVVSTDGSVGRRAVVLAYVLPLLMLVAGIVAGKAITGSDAWGALAGLAILIPYFAVLFLMRHKVRSSLRFSITSAA